MSRELPPRPSLEQLRKQAKDLLGDFRNGDPAAAERLRAADTKPPPAQPKLADAQRAVAREHGFSSWAKLKRHVESLTAAPDPMASVAEAFKAGDAKRLGELIQRHPDLKSRINAPLPGGPS